MISEDDSTILLPLVFPRWRVLTLQLNFVFATGIDVTSFTAQRYSSLYHWLAKALHASLLLSAEDSGESGPSDATLIHRVIEQSAVLFGYVLQSARAGLIFNFGSILQIMILERRIGFALDDLRKPVLLRRLDHRVFQ